MMLFEVGVRMERTLENGTLAKALEQYVVDALTFTEAEKPLYMAQSLTLLLSSAHDVRNSSVMAARRSGLRQR